MRDTTREESKSGYFRFVLHSSLNKTLGVNAINEIALPSFPWEVTTYIHTYIQFRSVCIVGNFSRSSRGYTERDYLCIFNGVNFAFSKYFWDFMNYYHPDLDYLFTKHIILVKNNTSKIQRKHFTKPMLETFSENGKVRSIENALVVALCISPTRSWKITHNAHRFWICELAMAYRAVTSVVRQVCHIWPFLNCNQCIMEESICTMVVQIRWMSLLFVQRLYKLGGSWYL